MTSPANPWPALAYADWADTCNTLHLWTQIAGKLMLALAPLTNHWWGIVLYWIAGFLYVGQASRVIRAGRAEGSAAARTGEPA